MAKSKICKNIPDDWLCFSYRHSELKIPQAAKPIGGPDIFNIVAQMACDTAEAQKRD